MNSFGLIIIYFIVFGGIAGSLSSQLIYDGAQNLMTKRQFYSVFIALVLYPTILKKEMKELKIVSVILFIGISAFILLFAG